MTLKGLAVMSMQRTDWAGLVDEVGVKSRVDRLLYSSASTGAFKEPVPSEADAMPCFHQHPEGAFERWDCPMERVIWGTCGVLDRTPQVSPD